MRKLNFWIVSILFTFAILAGCGDQNNGNGNNNENNNANNDVNNTSEVENNETEQNENEAVIVVTLSKDDGEETISEEEIAIDEGDILLDVMTEHYDVEQEDGLITSINGIEADESNEEAWIYFVDDEMATVGAAEYELSADEKVRFDFQKWN